MDINKQEFSDEYSSATVMKTTCKKAFPNFGDGYGDNMWAESIVLLEMITGQHPAMINGTNLESILETLKEHDFFVHFIQSKVYIDHYENDEEFVPVKKFLKLGLNRKPIVRETYFDDTKRLFKNIRVPSNLAEDLAKYYDLSDVEKSTGTASVPSNTWPMVQPCTHMIVHCRPVPIIFTPSKVPGETGDLVEAIGKTEVVAAKETITNFEEKATEIVIKENNPVVAKKIDNELITTLLVGVSEKEVALVEAKRKIEVAAATETIKDVVEKATEIVIKENNPVAHREK